MVYLIPTADESQSKDAVKASVALSHDSMLQNLLQELRGQLDKLGCGCGVVRPPGGASGWNIRARSAPWKAMMLCCVDEVRGVDGIAKKYSTSSLASSV